MVGWPACQRCAEDLVLRVGVYRDRVGETLCDYCAAIDVDAPPPRDDYDRPMEPIGETHRKRERYRDAV